MVNGIRTIYFRRLNKGFGSEFRVGSQDVYETTEESQRMHQPKPCEYNNKDEDNSPNKLNEKKDQFLLSNSSDRSQK